MNQPTLTTRQQETLDWIRNFHRRSGYMPTTREIADGIGVRSTNTVVHFLNKIEEAGFLVKAGNGHARAMTLVLQKTVPVTSPDSLDDSQAMNLIAEAFRQMFKTIDRDGGGTFVEDLATIVRRTGRKIPDDI